MSAWLSIFPFAMSCHVHGGSYCPVDGFFTQLVIGENSKQK